MLQLLLGLGQRTLDLGTYRLAFYRTGLIPRWLSVGVVGVAALMVSVVLVAYDVTSSPSLTQILFALPIAIQRWFSPYG